VFGSPFSVGYQSAVGYDALHSGAVGVSLPRPGIVAELLVLPYRGLFWVAPVLLAAPVAFVVAWRRGGARGAADRPMLVALELAAGAFLGSSALSMHQL
jgi:hypothetical protein